MVSLSCVPRPKQLSPFFLLTGRSAQPASARTKRVARNTGRRCLQARALEVRQLKGAGYVRPGDSHFPDEEGGMQSTDTKPGGFLFCKTSLVAT